MTASQLALGYALDVLLGDPEWLPHPVRWFGSLIQAGEHYLRRFDSGGPRTEMIAGAALTPSVVPVGRSMGRPKNPHWPGFLRCSALSTRALLISASDVLRAIKTEALRLTRPHAV